MMQIIHDYNPTEPVEKALWAMVQMSNVPRVTCDASNLANRLNIALRDAYPVIEVKQDGEGLHISFAPDNVIAGWGFAITPDGKVKRLFVNGRDSFQ